MQFKLVYLYLIGLIVCFIQMPGIGQINIQPSNIPPYNTTNLISQVLLDQGVEIRQIDFFGDARSVGVFSNGTNHINLESGLVISTGFASSAGEPNAQGYSGSRTSGLSVSDSDLEELTSSQVLDIAKYEIRFVPFSDKVRFNYVFASEEYPEFVCSPFNDVFGFFISGPDPAGGSYDGVNIARIPDPIDPSGQSFLNFPVSINSVNSGEIGAQGDNISFCQAPLGSLNFSQYYNETDVDDYPVYDGYLNSFIAEADVIPCQEYVIKIAIGDGDDDDYDSAVFLEAKSFGAGQIATEIITPGIDLVLAESCGRGQVIFNLLNPIDIDYDLNIRILNNGEFPDGASLGSDFEIPNIPNQIPAGSNSAELEIETLEDNQNEDLEYIYIEYQKNQCQIDTIRLALLDDILEGITVVEERTVCESSTPSLFPLFDEDFQLPSAVRFSNRNDMEIDADTTAFISSINVTEVLPDLLARNVISKVCIDTLTHRYLDQLNMFLVTPGGAIVELSSNNGDRVNNDAQIDSLINTCFTINGDENINRGNPILGPMDPANPTYNANYIPEGNWGDIYREDDQPSNGTYQLIIVDDVIGDFGTLFSWSIIFNEPYRLTYQWYKDGMIFDDCLGCERINPVADEDALYTLEVTDNYGCTLEDETQLIVIPLPEVPNIIDCETISGSQLLLTWDPVPGAIDYVVTYNGVNFGYNTGGATQYQFEGLIAGTLYTLKVRALNGDCTSTSAEIECMTGPCQNTVPVIDSIVVIEPACFGSNDGMLTIYASDPEPPFAYFIDNLNSNNKEWTNLSSGSYYIRIIDAENCGIDTTIIIGDPEQTELEFEIEPVQCRDDNNGTITVIPTGSNPPFTAEWDDGSSGLINMNASPGMHIVTVTDSRMCNTIGSVELLNPERLFVENFEIDSTKCNGSADGSVSIFVTGGIPGYTYQWNDPFGQTSSTATGLGVGVYNVLIKDSTDCEILESYQIFEPEPIEIGFNVISLDCFGTNTSEIEAMATKGRSPYSYEWSNGQNSATAQNLPTGINYVTVTDGNDCMQIDSFIIDLSEAFEVDAEIVHVDCFDEDDGSIVLYVDGILDNSYLYDWEDNAVGNQRVDLAAAEYCVTITNTSKCSLDTCFTVNTSPQIKITLVEQIDASCNGAENGSLTISIEGGQPDYQVVWSNGVMDTHNPNLSSGSYTVSVTDMNDCTVTANFDVTQPFQLLATNFATPISCFGLEDGSIIAEGNGGLEPYEFDWSTGDTGPTIENLGAGFYYLSVTDAENCLFVDTIEIIGPDQPLSFYVDVTEASCPEIFDGVFNIVANGGYPPYQYSVNNGPFGANSMIPGLEIGTYQIEVKDNGGCIVERLEIQLTSPEALMLDLGPDTTLVFDSFFDIVPIITNGNGNIEYQWSIQGLDELECTDCPINRIEFVQNSGIVNLIIVDEKGCSAEDFITIFIEDTDQSLVNIPSGFTPNGDGSNDLLSVFGQPDVTVLSFEVYARWGSLVYSEKDFNTNDETIGWDGRFNDQDAQGGIYYWMAEVQNQLGEIIQYKGHTTLIR